MLCRGSWEYTTRYPSCVALKDQAAKALGGLPRLHRAVPPAVRRYLRHRLGRYYPYEFGFDFHQTPSLREGEINGPPDFVGIGAQEAGTTWWFQLIASHPKVSHLRTKPTDRHYYSSIHKERHFFARFGTEPFGPSDIEEYHRWFPHRKGTITGEWTSDYLYEPWVPPLLARAAPDAKILVNLRDPVERFRSGCALSLRYGAEHQGSVVAEAVGRSMYADNLTRWLDHFPAEQVLVLLYEDCVAASAEQLKRTYDFLELDPNHRPPDIDRPRHKTAESKPRLDDQVRRRLTDIFSPDIAKLAKMLPTLDFSSWESFRDE
jgi:Sulfotransferase family